ncbi:unnamed protein product [Cercopithifilaria johnstoni]|uniref:LisH domain-containing protein n=1 Tax=Cercopithifilaria johnstoni TaxID=2874296 RepID=A0A8J2Q777_9BILA|nr:unnamed protein product [Cercopithifilaria johnstoni]
MDSNISDLKQAIIDKLRLNGTLDRIQKLVVIRRKKIYIKIQAELRCAVFLAIESNDENESIVDKSKLNQTPGYSIIYHFLKQNRFLATAAVFEKEIHQKIISLEELKKDNAAKFCFQFFGDSINLSNFIVTEAEQTKNESHSTRIGINEMNNIDSNFISSSAVNSNGKSDAEIIEKQQINNFESNRALKDLTLESGLSNDQNRGIFFSRSRNERRNKKEIQNDRPFETSNDDKIEKYNKGSSSSSRSSSIIEQHQEQQTPKTSPPSTMSKYQQQSTKYFTSPSSTYPRKLPPIKAVLNESASSTKLPSIPSLNNPANRAGTGTVPFSRLLDTILNSPSSNKSGTDKDIVEELIADDLLQSDHSDTTVSF